MFQYGQLWIFVFIQACPAFQLIKKLNSYHSVDIMVTSERRGSCGGVGDDGECEGSRVFVARGRNDAPANMDRPYDLRLNSPRFHPENLKLSRMVMRQAVTSRRTFVISSALPQDLVRSWFLLSRCPRARTTLNFNTPRTTPCFPFVTTITPA
mgnify:CR=1 FL=1